MKKALNNPEIPQKQKKYTQMIDFPFEDIDPITLGEKRENEEVTQMRIELESQMEDRKLEKQQKLNLIDNMDLNLQIGRSFFNCKIKKPFKLFSCCNNVNEMFNYNLYFKQNAKKIGMKKVLTVRTEVEED